jgi:hypothetical protein
MIWSIGPPCSRAIESPDTISKTSPLKTANRIHGLQNRPNAQGLPHNGRAQAPRAALDFARRGHVQTQKNKIPPGRCGSLRVVFQSPPPIRLRRQWYLRGNTPWWPCADTGANAPAPASPAAERDRPRAQQPLVAVRKHLVHRPSQSPCQPRNAASPAHDSGHAQTPRVGTPARKHPRYVVTLFSIPQKRMTYGAMQAKAGQTGAASTRPDGGRRNRPKPCPAQLLVLRSGAAHRHPVH